MSTTIITNQDRQKAVHDYNVTLRNLHDARRDMYFLLNLPKKLRKREFSTPGAFKTKALAAKARVQETKRKGKLTRKRLADELGGVYTVLYYVDNVLSAAPTFTESNKRHYDR
jgi:hypothetical protein